MSEMCNCNDQCVHCNKVKADNLSVHIELTRIREALRRIDELAREAAKIERPCILDLSISILEPTARVENCLTAAEIYVLGDLASMSLLEIYRIKNMGKKSVLEIESKLKRFGIKLKEASYQEEKFIKGVLR